MADQVVREAAAGGLAARTKAKRASKATVVCPPRRGWENLATSRYLPPIRTQAIQSSNCSALVHRVFGVIPPLVEDVQGGRGTPECVDEPLGRDCRGDERVSGFDSLSLCRSDLPSAQPYESCHSISGGLAATSGAVSVLLPGARVGVHRRGRVRRCDAKGGPVAQRDPGPGHPPGACAGAPGTPGNRWGVGGASVGRRCRIYHESPGGMAERTNAQLLKSCEVQASVGSNPTPSAHRHEKKSTPRRSRHRDEIVDVLLGTGSIWMSARPGDRVAVRAAV